MKKIILSTMSIIIVILSFPYSVKATEARTVLCLDYGDITIGESVVSGYDENGEPVSEINPCGYTVVQNDPETALDRSISISSGTQDIEIENINILRTDENGYALCVLKNTDAMITLVGENHLVAGSYRAGIDIAVSASVTINGDGILYAQSELEAGIGGGNGKSNGTLTINSGTIYATGGIDGYSAGIGGGSSGKGGTITINGGNVVAVGGAYAAGIGGGNLSTGGTITINGGTVTAVGGMNGAGIGGGFSGSGGTVIINGGSVKAVGGTDADDIGNGYKCSKDFSGIHNSDGNEVELLTVPITDFDSVYQNGINKTPITTGHSDDTSLYFYTDTKLSIATVYMSDGTVKFLNYNTSGFTEIFPFSDGDERYLDCLIVKDSNNISVASDYSLEQNEDEFSLISNEICIDSFKTVTRGDVNFDGIINGMDAVEAACVESGLLTDTLLTKISDINCDGNLESEDIDLLAEAGIMTQL